MVLDIQWLAMLGSVICNWKHLTMDFHWDNQARRLQGISQPIQATTLASVTKKICQGQLLFAIYLQSNEKVIGVDSNPDIQQILREYTYVVKEPTTLPPQRDIDHH